ncbi:MAG: tRNA pseudouridine synthase B [uncultured bacterium]|nr:MAG: tRNA pseudouridine synthase B [uncultured bacterium]
MSPSGFINLNKPSGITSHGAAQKLKKITGIRRIGHTGTLDPFATGVLVIAIGKTTKLIEFVMKTDKEYLADIVLGRETDTFDRMGKVTKESKDASIVNAKDIKTALKKFTGDIKQMPPKFSALKIKGTPAYKLAREGKNFELKPRPVKIYEVKLIEFRPPFVRVNIKCSSGTYIRSFANDIGKALKCGAYLENLQRLTVGDFNIKDSVKLDDITEKNFEEKILPASTVAKDMASINLDEDQVKRVKLGQRMKTEEDFSKEKNIALFDKEKNLIAVGSFDANKKEIKPEKVLI